MLIGGKVVYSGWLEDYVIDCNDDIYKACWKLHKNGRILICMDNDGKFRGVITFSDLKKTYYNSNLKYAGDICNCNCKYVIYNENYLIFARNIFIDFTFINDIPVIDKDNNLLEIVSREQAMWMKYYQESKLPRMHYAYCIYSAALEARKLGYKKFSVLEFGVAGGNGLRNCEFHAEAISRLLDVEIEIYGFDWTNGLPIKNLGYKDMVNIWPGGSFKMDVDLLKQRLKSAKLVLGDIHETTKTFINDYEPAPIGCMLIDVDYYSSTKPILKFIDNEDKFFLPRVSMYFDDIITDYEFQGEQLAICEFNRLYDKYKISPEKSSIIPYFRGNVKLLHRFTHGKYNEHTGVFYGGEDKDYNLYLGNVL